MPMEIPEEILRTTGLTEADCLIGLAVRLYAERRISIAQALRLSGISRLTFEKELARRNLTLYTVVDLHDDVDAFRELRRQ